MLALPLRMAHIVWFRQLPVQAGVNGEFFVVSLIYVCMIRQLHKLHNMHGMASHLHQGGVRFHR